MVPGQLPPPSEWPDSAVEATNTWAAEEGLYNFSGLSCFAEEARGACVAEQRRRQRKEIYCMYGCANSRLNLLSRIQSAASTENTRNP